MFGGGGGAIGAIFDRASDSTDRKDQWAANIYSAQQTEENQRRAIRANKNMQGRDFQFQREMRGTMYQDMVKDLEAAGLNPILAYQKQGIGGSSSGSGAPAPSAQAQASKSKFGSASLLNDASAKLMKEKVNTEKSQQRLNNAQAELTGSKDTMFDIPNELVDGILGSDFGKNLDEKISKGLDFLKNHIMSPSGKYIHDTYQRGKQFNKNFYKKGGTAEKIKQKYKDAKQDMKDNYLDERYKFDHWRRTGEFYND